MIEFQNVFIDYLKAVQYNDTVNSQAERSTAVCMIRSPSKKEKRMIMIAGYGGKK